MAATTGVQSSLAWLRRPVQTIGARRRGIKLHGIRHLNASLLIASQPIPIVAQRLGHSRVDATLRTYAHILPGQDQAAAEAIDAAL
jgi:integrase